MTYRPGQVAHVYPYLRHTPRWFVVGGPADGDEAQCAARRWPGVKVLGAEPCPEMHAWQLANGFPGPLLPVALSDRCGRAAMRVQGRGSTLRTDRGSGEMVEVDTVTLDALDASHGPIEDAVLWLDIEGLEVEVLRGAEGLLNAGRVWLINVEVIRYYRDSVKALEGMMKRFGFRCVMKWNNQRTHHDRVYVLKRGLMARQRC